MSILQCVQSRSDGRGGRSLYRTVVRERGHASEAELNAVRAAGYDSAQLIEIVRHGALNTWTNAINVAFKQ